MPDEMDEIKESAIKEPAGWTRLNYPSGKVAYRSPGGIEIPNNRFYKLKNEYKNQDYIPESVLIDDSSTVASSTTKSGSKSSKQQNYQQETSSETETQDNILNLPNAKAKAGRPSGDKATAKELATSAETTFLIATSILSLILQIPDIAMTDMEAKSISIPLANILEGTDVNKKFGKLLASSGDYQLLGYALYLYGHRVVSALQERSNLNGSTKSSGTAKNATVASGNTTTGGSHRPPVNLPYSGKNPSWSAGIAQ